MDVLEFKNEHKLEPYRCLVDLSNNTMYEYKGDLRILSIYCGGKHITGFGCDENNLDNYLSIKESVCQGKTIKQFRVE